MKDIINKIYNENKILDSYFNKEFNLYDSEIIKKNKVELLCELMEFSNETRIFKYWKEKTINYEDMLYEYGDVLIMLLSFYNIYNKEIVINNINESIDKCDLLIKIIDLVNNFIQNDILSDNILSYFLKLGEILEINKFDIEKYTLNKVESMRSNYE